MAQDPFEIDERHLENSENATPQPPDEYSPDFAEPDGSSILETKGDSTARSVLAGGDKKRPQRKSVDGMQLNTSDTKTAAHSIRDDPSTQALMAELKALEANQNGGPTKRRPPKPLRSKPRDAHAAREEKARNPPKPKPLWMGAKHEARVQERRRAVEISKPNKEDRRRLREYHEQQRLRAEAKMKQMQENKEKQQQLAEAKEIEKRERHEKLLQSIAENQAARGERNQRRNKIMEEAKSLLTKDHVPLFKKLEMKFQVAAEDEQRQKQEDYKMGRGKLYKMKLKDFLASPPQKPSASSDPGTSNKPTKFEDYMEDSPKDRRRTRTKGPRPPASAPVERSHDRHANKPQDDPPPAPPTESGSPTNGISFADFMNLEKGKPKSSKERLMKSKKSKHNGEISSTGPATVPEEDEDPLATSASQATKQYATQEVQVSAQEMSEERGCSPITFADRATSPCWIMAPTAAAAALATALAQIQLSGGMDSTTMHSLRNSVCSMDKAPAPSTSTSINTVIYGKTSDSAVGTINNNKNNNNPTLISEAVLEESTTPATDLATPDTGEPIPLRENNNTSAVEAADSMGQLSISNQDAAVETAGSVVLRHGIGEVTNGTAEAANPELEETLSPRVLNDTANAMSVPTNNQEDPSDEAVDLEDSDQAYSQIRGLDVERETEAKPALADERQGTPEGDTFDAEEGNVTSKQEMSVEHQASASAIPTVENQGSVDTPAPAAMFEEVKDKSAGQDWPEKVVNQETVADVHAKEANMEATVLEPKSPSVIGSDHGALDSVHADTSPRSSIASVYPEEETAETVEGRVGEAPTYTAGSLDGPLGEVERAGSAKSARSSKSAKSTTCVGENVKKDGNVGAAQGEEAEDENRDAISRAIVSGASARSTEFERLANEEVVLPDGDAGEIKILNGNEKRRSLISGASTMSMKSVDSASEVGEDGEKGEVVEDWARPTAMPAESAGSRDVGESAQTSAPEEIEAAPEDERATHQPDLEVQEEFPETEPKPEPHMEEMDRPETQPEPALDIEEASRDLREAFAAHTLARRRVMESEDLLKMVPGVSSDPRWVVQRGIRGVKTASAAYAKMSGDGGGEFLDEPLDDEDGEDDETRRCNAAIAIQRYWGGHADRKHFVYRKARSELDKSQQRIDDLQAKYRVRENPVLQQLVFQLETEESQSMFSSFAPAPMAPKKQKMTVTAQPVVRSVRRGKAS